MPSSYSQLGSGLAGKEVGEEVVAVHNHGSEEGPGLSCNEITLDDGTIKGVCLGNEDLKDAVLKLYYADLEEGWAEKK